MDPEMIDGREAAGWVCGDDGFWRPAWASVDTILRDYYDTEWGRPVRDERGMFERISLEAFQSGLSWATILRKREAFRELFCGFDPDKIAEFGDEDIERLMQDVRIVRNRRKIEATIGNAKAAIAMREDIGLAEFVWEFEPVSKTSDHEGPSNLLAEPTTSPESFALSQALKGRGFSFVGPTTMYALMQAVGMIVYSVNRQRKVGIKE